MLHRMQVPVSTTWGIERSPSCIEARQKQQQCTVVSNISELYEARESSSPYISLVADVSDNWWLRVLAFRPPQVAVVSAPCPPWSRAANAPGLKHPDGQLLLRMADVCGTAEVPVVVLEQVEGFAHHAHYSDVLRAWGLSGYTVVWQDILDAQAVLPAARKRLIIVLRHKVCPVGFPLPKFNWGLQRQPSLSSAKAILDLPPDMTDSLILPQDVWQTYMDPWYLPNRSGTLGTPESAYAFRVKTGQQSTGCFLAQDAFQHQMPHDLLERRGLLGHLVHDGVRGRFFAGAEIAVTLGAVGPVCLSRDMREQNKGLGNAISVPHAAIGLLFAAATLRMPGLPSPEQVLSFLQSHRLRSDNAVFVPSGLDWILCPKCDLTDLLRRLTVLEPSLGSMDLSRVFVPFTVQAPGERVTVQVAQSADLAAVLSFLGLEDVGSQVPETWGPKVQAMTVQVPALPCLTCEGQCVGANHEAGLTLRLTPAATYVLDSRSPVFWPQVVQVVHQLQVTAEEAFAMYVPTGVRLPSWDPKLPCCLACAEPDDQELFPLSYWAGMRPEVEIQEDGAVRVLVSGDTEGVKVWLGMPYHSLHTIGWQTRVIGFPPKPSGVVEFLHQPRDGVLRVVHLHRAWLLVAELQALQAPLSPEQGVLVDVQESLEGCPPEKPHVAGA